jgi:hypothetical protein
MKHGGFSGVAWNTMKRLIQLPLLLGAVLLLGACDTISTRINEKAPVFYSLDPNTRAKVAHGDVELGYTPDMVYIALGAPDVKRERVSKTDGNTEQWIYRSYVDNFDDIGPYGPGFYGYHRWYAPYGGYYRMYWEPFYWDRYRSVPEDDIRITFREGKVIMIDQARA